MKQNLTSHTATDLESVLSKFIVEGADANSSTLPHASLTPEDMMVILNFPVTVARELLDKIKDPSMREALDHPSEAKLDMDNNDLMETVTLLRQELAFIAAPNHPALTDNLSLALFTAMTNYLILVDALRLLSSKEYEYTFSWENTMDMVSCEIPKGLHFPLLIKHVWLGLAVHAIKFYVNNNGSPPCEEEKEKFPQYSINIISKDNKPKNSIKTLQIHNKSQHSYTLSVDIDQNDDKIAIFSYTFPENNDVFSNLNSTVNTILNIRSDILKIVSIIKMCWNDFITNMKRYAIKNRELQLEWMKSIVNTPEYVTFSFMYSDLRKCILSLNHDIQSDPGIESLCNKYSRKYKNYIPIYVYLALEIAYIEINEILSKIRLRNGGIHNRSRDERHKNYELKEPIALQYMNKHPDRFKVITQENVSEAIRECYDNDNTNKEWAGNDARNLREYILRLVAKNLGRKIPRLTIRKLIKSMK